jgi:hypothetical protein
MNLSLGRKGIGCIQYSRHLVSSLLKKCYLAVCMNQTVKAINFVEGWCESAASSGKGCTLNPELDTGDYFPT